MIISRVNSVIGLLVGDAVDETQDVGRASLEFASPMTTRKNSNFIANSTLTS